jgi:hypothetical protein
VPAVIADDPARPERPRSTPETLRVAFAELRSRLPIVSVEPRLIVYAEPVAVMVAMSAVAFGITAGDQFALVVHEPLVAFVQVITVWALAQTAVAMTVTPRVQWRIASHLLLAGTGTDEIITSWSENMAVFRGK